MGAKENKNGGGGVAPPINQKEPPINQKEAQEHIFN